MGAVSGSSAGPRQPGRSHRPPAPEPGVEAGPVTSGPSLPKNKTSGLAASTVRPFSGAVVMSRHFGT